MRDPKRIPLILRELEKAWKQNPDYRLTQLIIGVAQTGEVCSKLFNMENEDFLIRLEKDKNKNDI